MGLLDDMGPLLKGKPKQMPGMDFGLPDIAPGVGKSPMDFGINDLAKPAPSMNFGLDDVAPGASPPGPAMGPTGKIASQLGEGSKMLPQDVASSSPSMPTPGSGLLANAPLPPSRPAGLGGMPPTRSAAAVPLPPARPAGLGGAPEVASADAPPMPPVRPPGLGLEATGGMMASAAPPIAPIAPPIAPIAPPIAAPTPAPQAPVGAAGGAMGGLGGLGSALGGIAKAIQGKPGPPPPQAKTPQITPSTAGPETSQQQAKASAQAPQILQGLLAQDKQDTLDPRKRRMG
jgi:hypothetical protein